MIKHTATSMIVLLLIASHVFHGCGLLGGNAWAVIGWQRVVVGGRWYAQPVVAGQLLCAQRWGLTIGNGVLLVAG